MELRITMPGASASTARSMASIARCASAAKVELDLAVAELHHAADASITVKTPWQTTSTA